ncbi:dihydrofolate reductase FolA (plasmid) [Legionella adelaidensis]|uniref:Dihydrofolate reductase n=1 Tax=Legionella adelaidensis TaxID=45056 RepID=A0A0W0R1C4_9GAMM|nr:dihydrofolate reductase [Legionella adelaidensis]KTC64900.1 dihydrofolate reductase FolA [Legionella adelaidensis]VEH82928.1 dihydrofolate reductase FolA [Legionella adelaidensis]
MTIISLIAALDEKRGIGKNNQLLCHLPADLKHFKNITMGKPIIMGRKTFESIGKPLPGRQNIVLSKKMTSTPEVEVFPSLEEALAYTDQKEEIMIIGGANVFSAALPKAQRMYLTYIHHQFDADVFFPDFDMNEWESEKDNFYARDEKNLFDLTFRNLRRKK